MQNLYSPLTIPATPSHWILKAMESKRHNAPLLIVVEELMAPSNFDEAAEDRLEAAMIGGFLNEFWHESLAQYWATRPRAAGIVVFLRGDDGKWLPSRTESRP